MVCTVLQLKSFVACHWDMYHCASVVLFLESDLAVVGLIAARKVQIWGRKIESEIMAPDAGS